MSDRFIFTRYRTDCYHCRQMADQIIKAVPYKAEVACDNCGATRVFVPRIEDVDATGIFTRLGRYDVWQLAQDAACRHCGLAGPHDITVGTRHLTVRCRHCNFTHFYKFDLEYLGKDAIRIPEK